MDDFDIDEIIFGTPSHMLTRRDDPSTSHAAGQAVDTTKMEEIVFDVIKSFEQVAGCTSYEIHLKSGLDLWSITPRVAGLKHKGIVYCRGDTRKGKTNRQMEIIRVGLKPEYDWL